MHEFLAPLRLSKLPNLTEELLMSVQNKDVTGVVGSRSHIVGNHHDGDVSLFVKLGDRGVKLFFGVGVKPTRRLIKDEKSEAVVHRTKRTREQDPLLLSTGKLAKGHACKVLDTKQRQNLTNRPPISTRVKRPHSQTTQSPGKNNFLNIRRKIALYRALLRQIADVQRLQSGPKSQGTHARSEKAEYAFDKGALTASIAADDTEIVAGMDATADATDRQKAVIGKPEIFAGDERLSVIYLRRSLCHPLLLCLRRCHRGI
jgi:hypothetical protein